MYILEERLKDSFACDMDELKSCVQILTNKGVFNPTTTSIHFTPKYGSTIDLAGRLPSKSPYIYLCCPSVVLLQVQIWHEFHHFAAVKIVVRRTIFGRSDCFAVMLSADSSSVSPGQFVSIERVMSFFFFGLLCKFRY